jgi:HEPN domain-containing protein
MNPNELESLQWIQFALEDLKSAKLILDSSNDWVVPRNVCYLSQQSVEKFLKAIYIFENQRFHKVHDLDSLKNNLPASWNDFGNQITNLAQLTDWAIEGRYPGEYEAATIEDANLAYSHAKEIILLIVNEFQNRGLTLNSSILEIL